MPPHPRIRLAAAALFAEELKPVQHLCPAPATFPSASAAPLSSAVTLASVDALEWAPRAWGALFIAWGWA